MMTTQQHLRATVAVLLGLAALLLAHPSVAKTVYTGPYLLQTDDPSCMRILWQTSTDLQASWVRWGYSSGTLNQVIDAITEHQNVTGGQDFNRFDAWICGAAPGLPIHYKVVVSSLRDYNDATAFYTTTGSFVLPLLPSATHVHFLGYGDTRDTGSVFQRVSKLLYDDLMWSSDITQTFVLHSGDVVYNGGQTTILYSDNKWLEYFSQYTAAKDLLKSAPVAVAMGNHDFHWDGKGDYPRYFFINFPYPQYRQSVGFIPSLDADLKDAYYSFDYGPVHVAVLNPYPVEDMQSLGGCQIGDALKAGGAQYEWLAKDLAASTRRWKVLLLHVAPLSCDCSIDDQVRNDLENLAKTSGVDLIVAGHDHYYTRKLYNGITHLVLGGGGAALDLPSTDCKHSVFHYAHFHVVDDGHLDVLVFKVNDDGTSEQLDSLTISKAAPKLESVSYAASSTSTDYRIPIRFSCTTPGIHYLPDYLNAHWWEFGDGSTSALENPLHQYPRPSDPSGQHTYNVFLEVTDGTDIYYREDLKVTVYIAGRVEPYVYGALGNVPIAWFLRPHGEALDEVRHFRGILTAANGPILESAPGTNILTARALTFQTWEGNVNVIPDGWINPVVDLAPVDHPPATVVIGSVPTGANVTATVEYTHTTVTGTTPFYWNLCCPGDNWTGNSCTFEYTVEKDGVAVQGTGGLTTDMNCNVLEPNHPNLALIYEHLPPSPGAVQAPLIVSEPSDQRVVNRGQALLRVSARSSGPLRYRWYVGESGDTSHPIYGATGPVYITPPLKKQGSHRADPTPTNYWVRVYAGPNHVDSRSASVTVARRGPGLLVAKPRAVRPGESVTLLGVHFDQTDIGENRVFFDEYEAVVQGCGAVIRSRAGLNRCDVIVPLEVAGRKKVNVGINANGVWSRSMPLKVLATDIQ